MKAVIQRVIDAQVEVDKRIVGKIDSGLLVYLGVAQDDAEKDADWLAEKIPNLRIFDDQDGVMNLSLIDRCAAVPPCEAKILIISQFTLLADARKGRRPSYNNAAAPEKAKQLYEYFINKIKTQNIKCETGEFQAHMKVTYTNDGPVTIILGSRE